MGELYEPFPELPKNIRQIGERDQVLKLYLEDYVNTYLKRLQPAKRVGLHVGLLLGSRETHRDTPYVFVGDALEMDSITKEDEKVVFTEDAWKKAYQDVEQVFPKRTTQGWFPFGGPGCTLSPLNYWRQHSQYFIGKNQLMYLNCGLEGEGSVYIAPSDSFYKLHGYGVYYEHNQMIQDYIIQRKDAPRAKAEVNDKMVRNFKQRMDEYKHEMERHGSTMGVLSGLYSALTVTVLTGGITTFNNYQKMHQMESVIASVTPDGSVKDEFLASFGKRPGIAENSSGKGWSAVDKPNYVIEEAAGKVCPTTAPAAENGKEQSSEVKPETMPAAETSALNGTAGGEAEREAAGAAKIKDTGGTSTGSGTVETRAAGTENSGTGTDGTKTERTTTAAGDGSGQASSGQADPTKSSGDISPAKETTLPPTGGGDGSVETVSTVSYSVYTVAGGETLYGICFKLYHNLKHIDEIYRINALTDENSIYTGQKLLIP